MEKVTQFLEKHVQWLVLGAAVLFLGYMAYAYLLESPVSVQIAGKTLLPGEINPEIVNGPVKRIQADMDKDAPPMPVNDFVTAFRNNMAFEKNPQYAYAFQPLAAPNWPGAGNVGTDLPGVKEDIRSVETVATLPAPASVLSSSGITVVNIPNPNAPAGVPANPAVPAVVQTKDLDWVTVAATVDPAQLKAAWIKAYGDPTDPNNPNAASLTNTRVLRVEMEREEKLPNGTWGKAQVVPALQIYTLEPLPAPDANEEKRLNYLDWASKNEVVLATPAFYEWANRGKPWWAPGTPEPGAAGAPQVGIEAPPAELAPFDPANPPKNRRLTVEEKKMVDEYKRMVQEQKRMEREQKNPPKPERGGGVRGPRPGPGHEATASLMGLSYGAGPVQQTQIRGELPTGTPGWGAGSPESPYTPSQFGQPGQPGQPGGAGGSVDAVSLQAPLMVWAHDENVQPGKSYRYRIRYTLANPVHGADAVVKEPKLAAQLYMTSPWSAWTDEIKIGEHVKYWLAGLPNSKEAKFEVYIWQDGNWRKQEEKATPGDPINGTTSALVDLRANTRGGGYTVIVVNGANGATERRDWKRDESDPERLRMAEEAAGAAGQPGGTPANVLPAASAGGV